MNTIQSVYDSLINLFNDNEILSKFTTEEIEEEIENVLSATPSTPLTSTSPTSTPPTSTLPFPDILAQNVIQALEYKYKFNEFSSEYDLLDKETFLSSITIQTLQSDKLLSVYDEDFSNLKARYKEENEQLRLRLKLQKQNIQPQLPVQLSQEELFNLTYPDLNTVLLPEEYRSRDANILCSINNLSYNAGLFTIEHYPLFAYTKNPINPPSILDHKLYPYGLPEMRESDPSTMLPINFDPSSEVYLIGVSLAHFKLKPDRLSCVRVRIDNSSCYDSTDWIEENSPRCSNSQFYFSQPAWEAFQERYDYQLNYILHFAVFKAKPVLSQTFKQYWDSQSDLDMFNGCSYFHICNASKLVKNLDIQYPVMKLFYSSYLMSYYLNITENVIKNLPQNQAQHITSVSALKPGDLVYVNRYNFGVITGKQEIFLDNGLIIVEKNDRFYFSDSDDYFIIPELLLFSESVLDNTLLDIKHNINKQHKVYMWSKAKKPATF